ncbi:MAG: hypothetical protein GY920_06285 [Aliivibrio sp.]|nr:hypothetical protein [Aliivibrio sp.]
MNKRFEQAIDKLTLDLFLSLEYGEEVELNEWYTLYRYCEDDIIVIVETEEWEEVCVVLIDGDSFVYELCN